MVMRHDCPEDVHFVCGIDVDSIRDLFLQIDLRRLFSAFRGLPGAGADYPSRGWGKVNMDFADGDGGRFELEPDDLVARLRDWAKLRDELLADQVHGKALLRSSSAGDEPASKNMANLVRRSGEEFLRHNSALVDYVNGYITALTAALETYVNGEDAAVRAMRGQLR